MVSVCGYRTWSLFVATEHGLCLWLQNMVSVCGYRTWSLFVATEHGLCLWLQNMVSVSDSNMHCDVIAARDSPSYGRLIIRSRLTCVAFISQ
ncbi:hypothetical protein RRG08_022913 [Elysia crispata]|uniref:Uncharacterized protein n=1 Tax=Elysia crispata TaxID=231223 RepID=A0AAE1CJE2_9GAST|nr:hypothetical protein RRG08_022913 [Elysia crispata]